MVRTVVQADLEKAREEAQRVCSLKGDSSPDCVASRDVVEELQAALAHHRVSQSASAAFHQYWDDNPDSLECRIYDV
ncbi:MAG: Calvin cycle protein CP12 [Cyanobacteria bacterium P01_F01_bin.42]